MARRGWRFRLIDWGGIGSNMEGESVCLWVSVCLAYHAKKAKPTKRTCVLEERACQEKFSMSQDIDGCLIFLFCYFSLLEGTVYSVQQRVPALATSFFFFFGSFFSFRIFNIICVSLLRWFSQLSIGLSPRKEYRLHPKIRVGTLFQWPIFSCY